ncbi:hypothetical protein SLS62_011164 [Diatrype stigma]|uniref:TRIP4/RQT4 C2HC5-type zinc finger domain-containing protein n=1 Tax=Diatrype stigma TaxID=117547 RepID=A0AAN9YEG6_9PEZI
MSIPQLSRLLPLPDEELKQVLDYAATLSKPEAAEHFSNLLGDSPGAIDFIASFNSRRKDPKAASASASASTPVSQPRSQPGSQPGSSHASDMDTVPKSGGRQKKKKPQIHALPPRQVTNIGPAPGAAYSKKNLQDDYMPGRPGPSATSSGRASPVKQQQQQQQQRQQQTPAPIPKSATPPPSKPPPSAQGHLISDMPKSKSRSTPASRSSTPGPKTKINISGGTAMRGASTVLTDLEAAIRALEISTNPTQLGEDSARRCNCVAARHPLLSAAPNCLSCGKVVCVKEGLGPCTFCGAPLLSSHEVQSMIRELRQEQGREKMVANKEAHRRPDMSKTPAPFSKPRDDLVGEAEAKALEHRDRLLGFQAHNAQRTTIRDEASDFDVVGAMAGTGGSIWTSPEERARELKRQQKILREMEWNAKPEYEKRQQVVSIDLVGGKVVRRMAAIERPKTPEEEDNEPELLSKVLRETSGNGGGGNGGGGGRAGGTFSKNPLLGGLIKPVFDAKGKGAELEGRKDKATRWRRVQDDLDNNEAVILDGGAYGGSSSVATEATKAVADEPGCG